MATHSSILAWEILWTEEPGRLYSPWGCKELDTTEQLSTSPLLEYTLHQCRSFTTLFNAKPHLRQLLVCAVICLIDKWMNV